MKKRIDLIDAVRGLAVSLMVIDHMLYDAVAFLNAPRWLFTNPILDVLHYFFVGVFVVISGISSRFSHSNIKRGAIVFAVAMGITIVTTLIGMPIRFGILHLLGFCMIFYGLTQKIWDGIPRIIMPIFCIIFLIGSQLATSYITINSQFLWMFGWMYPGFYSADYFPIFPWIFVFLLGTWIGKYIIDRKFPEWFYETKVPVLPAVGKKALIIYVVHQPILYGITMLIKYFI